MEPDTPTEGTEADPGLGVDTLTEIATDVAGQANTLLEALLRPWNAYQVGIALVLLAMAWLLRRLFGDRIRNWMATREGWPTWRMRILVVIHRRLMGIFFVALIWSVVWIMREVTWPSRSYLLTIFA
jgi:hypothetical protein